MFKGKITRISFSIALSIVLLMWLVFLVDYLFPELKLYRYGVYPLKKEGLIGILASPFLHSMRDFSHILSNSLPIFILSWLLFYHYRKIATKSFISIYLLTGVGIWLLGRENYHIGMSGVIYGLTSFLVFSGFFRKNMRVAGISLFVVFIYGSMVWGVLPWKEGVSWEAHLLGLFSGVIIAVIFKEKGPQPAKLRYEIEEELGIEPEFEYWRKDFIPPTIETNTDEQQPKISVRYHYTRNKKVDQNSDAKTD
jgi:membrane associated rhomboid family serine protease